MVRLIEKFKLYLKQFMENQKKHMVNVRDVYNKSREEQTEILKKRSEKRIEKLKHSVRQYWQAKYLGGYPEYPNAKSVKVYITKNGLEIHSAFFSKPLFIIPWAVIQDVGQDLIHKQEQSALGSMAQGFGMMSAGTGGGLAGYSLQSAGQASKKNVTEHYLEVYYLIKGIKGVVVFEFKPLFWNKRPVLEVMAHINKMRIEIT